MLTTFCLRLACGMIGCLLLLKSNEVNPRFFRTHYLVALGLGSLAVIPETWAVFAGAVLVLKTPFLIRTVAFLIALILCALGTISWSVEGNPGGRAIGVASTTALVVALSLTVILPLNGRPSPNSVVNLIGDLTSAALLGTAMTGMLLGHFYLIAPGMSLSPFLNLLTALFVATGLRMLLGAWGLWSWSADHSLINLEDETVLWLPVRWALGFGGPIVLGWMARSAAKIRSTQSATGILYVVVILTFLGELTSQILTAHTGYLL